MDRAQTKKSMGLRLRIVAVLLLASLLPLALLGIGSWVVFGNMIEDKTLDLHRSVVQTHARSIDRYLAERVRVLDLLARSHSLEELESTDKLRLLLGQLNDSYDKAFIDLGLIGEDGRHLAYAGPYQLQDKNYLRARWFKDVMSRDTYVSDVFLGFRHVPHCVIAVKRRAGNQVWILRATINSYEFERLVQTGQIAKTGDAFVVNSTGQYQTPSRFGKVLEQSPIGSPHKHRGVREHRVYENGATLLRATTWLNAGRWMLVVQQSEAEVNEPVRHAMFSGILVILLAVAVVVTTAVLSTWHLTTRINRATAERDKLSLDLLRSAKLACLGEMSTGLAHEINNPLAIISAEQTNIADVAGELKPDTPGRNDLLESVERCKRQVIRCGGITAKMLQFGRKTDTKLRPTDVAPRLEEIVSLMNRQAQLRNIDLQLEVEPDLPKVLLDPNELEQVLVNLINNALYATSGGGRILVSAGRQGSDVILSVADTGSGISPEDLEKIFQPFFTTKAPGKGTGLGLSVCYGIVQGWGGTIEARSEPGKNTTMIVRLQIEKTENYNRRD